MMDPKYLENDLKEKKRNPISRWSMINQNNFAGKKDKNFSFSFFHIILQYYLRFNHTNVVYQSLRTKKAYFPMIIYLREPSDSCLLSSENSNWVFNI